MSLDTFVYNCIDTKKIIFRHLFRNLNFNRFILNRNNLHINERVGDMNNLDILKIKYVVTIY